MKIQLLIKAIAISLISTSLFGQDLSLKVTSLIEANNLDSAELINRKLLFSKNQEDSIQFNNNQIYIHTLKENFSEADSILRLQSKKITSKSLNYGRYIVEKLRYRHYSSNDTNAISLYQKVIQDSLHFSKAEYFEILYFTGISLLQDNNSMDAKMYIFKAYYDPEIDNYPLIKAKIANAIAVMHDTPKDFKKKIKYLKEAIDLGNERTMMTAYANIAVAYGKNMNYDSAMYFVNRAIDLKKQLGGPYTGFFATRANIFISMNDFSNAILNYNLDYKNIDSADYKSLAVNRLNTGLAYRRQSGNTTQAKEYLKTALNYAIKTSNYPLREYIRRQLGDIYMKVGDFENAYSESIYIGRLKDSIFNERKLEISSELEVKYQTALKQAENEKLQQQNQLQDAQLKTQRAYMVGGGSILLLLGFLSALFYRQRKRQEAYNAILNAQNEKIDMLKREAIHRTNNHLTLATNLLVVQKEMAKENGAKSIIEDSERKLRAIAAANKRLSGDFKDENSLKEIIDETVRDIIFNIAEKEIEYKSQIEEVLLDKSHYSLIALIVNELTVNSIKHAFHNVESPQISILGVKKENVFTLIYSDNGKFTKNNKVSEGRELIHGLVDQMKGKIQIDTTKGYTFTLSISLYEK